MTTPKDIPVSPPPDIIYWSLLDHYVEGDKAARGSDHPETPLALDFLSPKAMDPTVMNPGFLTDSGVKRDAALQKLVDDFLKDQVAALEKFFNDDFAGAKKDVKTKKDLDEMLNVVRSLKDTRFALVDLTADVNSPKYAGNQGKASGAARELDLEPSFGGSMIKICAMYAAYQLQFDLNVLAKKLNISLAAGDDKKKKKAELFQAAWDTWVQTQKDDPKAASKDMPTKDPKLKMQGRLIKRAKGTKIKLTFGSWNGVTTWDKKHQNPIDGAPNLENIFDGVEGSPMKVTFKQDKSNYPPDHKLEGEKDFRLGEFGDVAGRTFYDRLFSCIDASNNTAAGSCIMDVGYLYIASALMQCGLYSPERGGGLWVSAPYPGVPNGTLWIENPLPMHDQIVGGQVNTSRHYQVGSAAAGATFVTLLAQNRLVSPLACDQMKFLMNKNKPGKAVDRVKVKARRVNGVLKPEHFVNAAWSGSDTYSPVQAGIEDADSGFPGTVKKAISKLGLSPAGDLSDCAYIERDADDTKSTPHGKKLIRYVICFVDLDVNTQARLVGILVRGLDECIRKTN